MTAPLTLEHDETVRARGTITALTAISRTRALTESESASLAHAHDCEAQRQRRLPARIVRLRAQLHELESELWPEAAMELTRLQAEADTARAEILEAEFIAHWGSGR
jgi:regulator of protease activity HflC (stomatin/prohibitin superfamily)